MVCIVLPVGLGLSICSLRAGGTLVVGVVMCVKSRGFELVGVGLLD